MKTCHKKKKTKLKSIKNKKYKKEALKINQELVQHKKEALKNR